MTVMTQGRSQIVSWANLDSIYDKFEPFFYFFNKKIKKVFNQLVRIAETLFFSSQVVSSCVFWLFADYLLAIAEKV